MQTFSDFGLSDELLKAVQDLGYKTPSPIQLETIPVLLKDPTDFVGLAATGTGKTAAFGLPLLERIDPTIQKVQALILCPTRELAIQVAEQINLFGKNRRIEALPIYGGASYIPQIHGLEMGAQIVVGTPGRVIDHMKRGTLKLETVNHVILDEADEMVSMGFKDELDSILRSVPRKSSHIWLFSATMSPEVRRVADTYLRNPVKVQVNRTEMLSSTVEQVYFPVRESNKPEVLCKLIEAADDFYGIIFCQTKSLVATLSQYLSDRGLKVDSLHGDKDQKARERTMKAFKERRVTVLVCTDVASRGLDVKDITHVVNYSLPREIENYVHRIGRTARSGKTGIAMSLVTPSHRRLVEKIEKLTKSQIKEGRIPSRKEIGHKRLQKYLPSFKTLKGHQHVLDLMSEEWKQTVEQYTKEEIAARFLALLSADVFEDRQDSKQDLIQTAENEETQQRPPRKNFHQQRKRERHRSKGFKRAGRRQ